MIGHQLVLVKRELWEHRSIFITPAAIGAIMALSVLATLMFASGFAKELDMVIFGAQNVAGEGERRAALTAFFVSTSTIFFVALAILTVFYCLDSLYAERKDKSILFWRSLPVTDAETVVSKLLTAVFVLPAMMAIGIFATHLINLITTSLWVSSKGGSAGTLIWGSVPILDNWLAALIVLVASGIWMAPFIGWFLLVSAWAKRMPLFWAFMPPIVLILVESIVLDTHFFAKAIGERGNSNSIPLFQTVDIEAFFEEEQWRGAIDNISLLELIDLGKFVTHSGTWVGLLVCAVFVTGAIYVRRFRDES